jgi:hypothetical protein
MGKAALARLRKWSTITKRCVTHIANVASLAARRKSPLATGGFRQLSDELSALWFAQIGTVRTVAFRLSEARSRD